MTLLLLLLDQSMLSGIVQPKDHSDCWDVLTVCIEKRIDLGNLVLVVLGLLGLLSVYLAYRQLQLSQRAQQTQLTIQLHDDFFDDPLLRAFLYRLDYSKDPRAWKFDPASFPHSDEERSIDLLLYKLSFVGILVRNGDVHVRDLQWLKVEARIVLENEQVLRYLNWVQTPEQIPGHSAFVGAVYLHQALFGRSKVAGLEAYLRGART